MILNLNKFAYFHVALFQKVYELSESADICGQTYKLQEMNHPRPSLKKRPGSTFFFLTKLILGLQLPKYKGRKALLKR